MKIRDIRSLKLLPIILLLIINLIFTFYYKTTEKNTFYNDQIEAANKMKILSNAVKNYKEELNIPIYDYDYFDTGLLGDEYNEYTTSLGHLESKRTSTNPNMAALVVKMFHEVGLKSGDHVAVGFSGSFPALNLAVLSASEVMGLDLTIISSFGSSTYGANQIELTFPKMLSMLNSDNYTKYNSSLVTMGGDDDVASEKPPELIDRIIKEYEKLNLKVMIEPNFQENINKKVDVYYSKKDVDCYIAVGGNLTFLGIGEFDIANKQGILKSSQIRGTDYGDNDGLINYFLSKNIPTIHLLNVKKIVADYGLPFDPPIWSPIGASNVYYKVGYSKTLPIITLFVSVVYIIYINKRKIWFSDRRNKEEKISSGNFASVIGNDSTHFFDDRYF